MKCENIQSLAYTDPRRKWPPQQLGSVANETTYQMLMIKNTSHFCELTTKSTLI